jgi:hypothetical protein
LILCSALISLFEQEKKGWRSPVLIGLVMDKDENSTQIIAEMAGKRPPGEQTPGLL